MNKRIRLFCIVLLLMAMPMRQFGQTVRNNAIEIELSTISNPDYRYCLFSYLANDENISYVINEEESSVLLSSATNLDERQFQAYFDALKAVAEESFTTYSSADKESQGATFTYWKERLPQDLFVLLFRQLLIENPTNRDGNQTCANSDPFCTTDVVTFHVDASAGGVCESGPNYGCMTPYTSRPPFWFHMKIAVAGTFTIQITNSNGLDLDFCAWGPFADPITPCPNQLTSDKIIDCDSPWNTVQECTVPSSSQVGQYYIMVITKYSSGSTDITFQKIPNSGPGETDCGILPGIVTNDGPYCVGETIHLSVNAQDGATYNWTGPAGFNSNQQNPTRPNCTLNMAGIYTCTTTVGTQSTSDTTNVVIYPDPTADFNYTTVCVGNATQFNSTSTTNPPGQQINSYQWNFGDGQTGTGQNTSHTYAQAGSYQVTLTVATGGHCIDQITKTVNVFGQPTSNFTFTSVCKGNPTQFTSTATAPSGQQISSYQWNFGDGQTGSGQTVSHTYAQAGDYQVTHTVDIGGGSCNDQITQTVPVYATPVPSATAQPGTVIYGGVATLSANAGATGSFNFHWEPANKVVNPNNQTTQTVMLYETTTFTVTVTNPQGGCTASAQVTVSIEGSNMVAMATADQTSLCEGESTTLHAQPSGGTGNYTYSWTPANTLNNPNIQHPVATPPVGTTTYTCHVSDGLSSQDVSVTIVVHPNEESDVYETICENDTYTFFGEMLQTPGVYDHTIETQYGCDSVIHLHLSNWQTYETTITDRFCESEHYMFFDQALDAPGIYFHTLESVHGCDSVIKLNLAQDPVYEFDYYESTCQGGLGYHYNGDYLQPSPYPYVYVYESVMGCDSIVSLHIEEAQYNSKSYNVSLCAEEYTWASNGITYYESGTYYDTLSYPNSCDSTLILYLELRPSFQNDVVVTSCDAYRWKNDAYNVDMTFNESTVYTHHYINSFGCDSEATLNLTINDHDESDFTVSDEENCDEYFWDPKGHEIIYTDHEDLVYTMSGTYHRTYKNQSDCDSLVTMNVQFAYTPHPTEIYPMDATNNAPHWVVTATEFQINSYDFNLWDTNPNCHWDTVTWSFSQPVNWVLEPFGEKAKCCKVYVLGQVNDTVWLEAHAFNRCAPQDGITQRYWLVCSFYGVEENDASTGSASIDFDVIPNPNKGEMQLNFEYLTGKVNVRVYDMKGTLIDQFETINNDGPSSYLYNMKNKTDGIYFFVATSKEGTVAKKVVIQR
ncbi:MAG: PKD domain-containing protein [Bacteroidales bacterium]|nr:PKD domain-containing protein [Bacteroidales bacterium]